MGSAAAAVSAARTRRARSGRNARIAAIAIAAVAAVAVAAFAVAPRLGINLGGGEADGYPAATDLAQMSPEEAGEFLSGLSEIYDGYNYEYATSDEVAEAAAKYGAYSDEYYEALEESGGSIYAVSTESLNGYIDATAVSTADDIWEFVRMRVIDEIPGVEEVVDTVRGLGGEHMLVWKDGPGLWALYTVGDGTWGELHYSSSSTPDVIYRSERASHNQAAISGLLEDIQKGDDYLRENLHTDIFYYE